MCAGATSATNARIVKKAGGIDMRMFSDVKGKGTYATPAGAEKKITDLIEKMAVDFRYVIISTVDGRYKPCVVLNSSQQHFAGGLAGQGICVTF